MKKIYYLIILLLTAGVLWTPYQGYSQDYFSNDKKISGKEKKEARKRDLYRNYKAIDTLLQNKTFVLEAEFLQGRYGYQVSVSSTLNFIRVSPDHVVLQTGTDAYPGGYNGLGGVTAEGTINSYTVTSDEKRLSHTVSFSTTTQIGTYDVMLRISADATATATIKGTTSGSLTYRGNLVAPYNSRVFKGTNSI